jgi:hypothetical protein
MLHVAFSDTCINWRRNMEEVLDGGTVMVSAVKNQLSAYQEWQISSLLL